MSNETSNSTTKPSDLRPRLLATPTQCCGSFSTRDPTTQKCHCSICTVWLWLEVVYGDKIGGTREDADSGLVFKYKGGGRTVVEVHQVEDEGLVVVETVKDKRG